jgi:hypothetical protein
MKTDEFVDRLKKKFSKEVSQYEIEDLRSWLERQEIGEIKLEMLYNLICENYTGPYFPKLAKIVKMWNDSGVSTYKRAVYSMAGLTEESIKQAKNYDIPGIVAMVSRIRDKEHTTTARISFVHTWDMLSYWYQSLVDRGWTEQEAESYCNPIRTKIEKGEWVGYDVSGIERKNVYSAIKFKSINNKFGVSKLTGKFYLTKEYREFKELLVQSCLKIKLPPPYKLYIEAGCYIDLSNFQKVLEDALEIAGVIDNDRNITEYHAVKKSLPKNRPGYLIVCVEGGLNDRQTY